MPSRKSHDYVCEGCGGKFVAHFTVTRQVGRRISAASATCPTPECGRPFLLTGDPDTEITDVQCEELSLSER